MSEQSQVMASAVVGALVGAVAGYLFFTSRGRELRGRMEPLVDDLRQEFARFQRTFEKVGDMANEGMRVVNEFNQARAQSPFSKGTNTH
jgi:gas vesicle protein